MDARGREDKQERRTADLIKTGGEIMVGVAGGALGTLGGPVGIAAGAVGGVFVAEVVTRLGSEIYERVLAPRQRARAGLALGVAVERMNERTAAGETPRDDGFFRQRPSGERPEAEELLEGVLLRAMNAYEERKVPFMGALFTSVAYRPDVSPAYAHLLLRLADQLTYRQLVALAYFAENEGDAALQKLAARREAEGAWEYADGLGRELAELGAGLGLLGLRQEDGAVALAAGTYGSADLTEHEVATIAPTDLGRDLYDLMDLSRISQEEKGGILELMERG